MVELPNINLSPADRTALEKYLAAERKAWVDSLKPKPDAFGLRRLPRDPHNPDRFLPVFKTDKHTYTVIGDEGIGFERFSVFQKRSLQRGFGRNFAQLLQELQQLKHNIAGEKDRAKLVTESIIHIQALQDSVADFGREQFEASLWLCTLFVLREDETVAAYSEQIAEEKMRDWAAFGFSELDFFLLSGTMIPGYGSVYNATLQRSEQARKKFLDVIDTKLTAPAEA